MFFKTKNIFQKHVNQKQNLRGSFFFGVKSSLVDNGCC